MEQGSHYTLVLTGSVLPGYAPERVWPALAAHFRMEAGKLDALRARAPLTIKRSDDPGKLQTLQAGIAAIGAETELCAPDERASVLVLLDNAPRGPLPRVFVDQRVEQGLWPAELHVAEAGADTWQGYAEYAAPLRVAPAATVAQPRADANDEAFAARAASPMSADIAPDQVGLDDREPGDIVTGDSGYGHIAAVDSAAADAAAVRLPAGAAIHAGFWRRCAAYTIDGFLVAMLSYAATIVIALVAGLRSGAVGALTFGGMLGVLAGLVIAWLYFALQESSRMQATLGKRAMHIKVTDGCGRRIGFGRATARTFAKALSSLLFDIGFMLAGWTARKQALHDLIADTFVVFRDVRPGQPLPRERPPMPWYGWLLNVLLIGVFVAAVIASWMFAQSMATLASGALQGGQGF